MAEFPFPQSSSDQTYTNEESCARFATVDSQLQSMQRAALEYLLKENYAQARIFATGALLVLAGIPDGQLGGISSQSWNKVGIQQFLNQLDKLEASASDSGGIVMMPVEYTGRRGGGC